MLAGIVPGWPPVSLSILRDGTSIIKPLGASGPRHEVSAGPASIIKHGGNCEPVDVLGVDPVGSLPVASVNRLATWCRGLGPYSLIRRDYSS